jgi:hypothetical protein
MLTGLQGVSGPLCCGRGPRSRVLGERTVRADKTARRRISEIASRWLIVVIVKITAAARAKISGQAPHASAGGAKRCKRFGEASLDRSFPMTDFRIPAVNSERKARAVLIET